MTSKNLFDNSTSIIELTPSDFQKSKKYQLDIDKFGAKKALVMFYAPWCPHCHHLKDTWNELGLLSKTTMMAKNKTFKKGEIFIAVFNCEKYHEFVKDMNLQKREFIMGFPTIYIYEPNKPPKMFTGERNIKQLVGAI